MPKQCGKPVSVLMWRAIWPLSFRCLPHSLSSIADRTSVCLVKGIVLPRGLESQAARIWGSLHDVVDGLKRRSDVWRQYVGDEMNCVAQRTRPVSTPSSVVMSSRDTQPFGLRAEQERGNRQPEPLSISSSLIPVTGRLSLPVVISTGGRLLLLASDHEGQYEKPRGCCGRYQQPEVHGNCTGTRLCLNLKHIGYRDACLGRAD